MRYLAGTLLALSLVGTAHAVDLSSETLAGIHMGDSVAVVKKHLGKPAKESKPIMGQATGEMESTLTYPHLEVGLGDGKVRFVQASSPSTYGTSKNVHVGDNATQATTAYGKLKQTDEAHNLLLNFEAQHGHVVEIYLGAGPE
jgi:hypothetical protein